MAHGTRINGTSYGIKGGKCLVNGTSYSIKKGITMVNGTKREIVFLKPTTITINAEKTFLSGIYINDVICDIPSGTQVTKTYDAGVTVVIKIHCEGEITVNGILYGNWTTYEEDVTGKTCLIEQKPDVFVTIQ